MCGRYTIAAGPQYIADYFHIDGPFPDFQPSWNITPGGEIPVICESPGNGRSCALMHWGLIPHWTKQPESKYNGLLAFAGLWDYWEGEHLINSCTIVTTGANLLLQTIHDRMPVILDEKDYALWLDSHNHDTRSLASLLRPCKTDFLQMYRVSTAVNNPAHDGPALIQPRD
jgi:putative SOS response-associated peptidase YedK